MRNTIIILILVYILVLVPPPPCIPIPKQSSHMHAMLIIHGILPQTCRLYITCICGKGAAVKEKSLEQITKCFEDKSPNLEQLRLKPLLLCASKINQDYITT